MISYLLRYSLFNARTCVLHIFLNVPAASHISPAMHRIRSGPLPTCRASLGEQVRARGGHLQLLGASPPCCTSLTAASAPGPDRTFDRQGQSRPALLGMNVQLIGIQVQRTLWYVH